MGDGFAFRTGPPIMKPQRQQRRSGFVRAAALVTAGSYYVGMLGALVALLAPAPAQARVDPLLIISRQIHKPNMLIVLDTSGSLTGVPGGSFTLTSTRQRHHGPDRGRRRLRRRHQLPRRRRQRDVRDQRQVLLVRSPTAAAPPASSTARAASPAPTALPSPASARSRPATATTPTARTPRASSTPTARCRPRAPASPARSPATPRRSARRG